MEGKTQEQATNTSQKKKQLQTLASDTNFLPQLGKIQILNSEP